MKHAKIHQYIWQDAAMNSTTTNGLAQRSQFVTATAWTFIVLAGCMTLLSLLQNVMLQVMLRTSGMRDAMAQLHNSNRGGMPPFAINLLDVMPWMFAANLVLCISTLIAAIGLLQRKEWARLMFIALMAIGIIWNIGGLVLQWYVFSGMRAVAGNAPAQFVAEFNAFTIGIVVVSFLFAATFSFLFGWIIKRLCEPAIAQEFRA
jgi:hypothetical protein